ncbi:unnamed protein product, partial [Mesorhabditis belari]|uniref:Parafibromin n=1 Tax=Mesorhabditis belari TaxID=2138241 RepID=A0AAF3J2W2_9BILA
MSRFLSLLCLTSIYHIVTISARVPIDIDKFVKPLQNGELYGEDKEAPFRPEIDDPIHMDEVTDEAERLEAEEYGMEEEGNDMEMLRKKRHCCVCDCDCHRVDMPKARSEIKLHKHKRAIHGEEIFPEREKMADPLKVLRDYAQGKRGFKEITQGDESFYLFDDIAYEKNTKTNLCVYGKENDYYTLESLYFIWERREIPHPAYVKEAAGKGIRAVTRPDRRDLLDYLRGERAEPPTNFDRLAQAATPIPVSRFQEFEPERKRQKLDTAAPGIAPRIEELLREDGPSTATEDETNLRALSDNLTADKIAALRKKKQNHQKRTTTAALDDIEMTTIPTEPTTQRDPELLKRERVWRTRNNCLEAQQKHFSSVLQLLQGIKMREETEARNKALGINTQAQQQAKQDPNRLKRGQVGYSRYDQEQFNKDEVGFDADLTFVGANLKNMPDKKAVTGVPLAPRGAKQSSSPVVSSTTDGNTLKKRTSRTPIIIIPASTNSNSIISMYNVREVLQDMTFVTTEKKKLEGKRENEVLVQRRKGGQTVPYRVVDTPQRLTSEEWDRVVAVFALGPTWQFKGWPRWNGNPAEIFANVAGFHLTYDNLQVDQNVARWSVKVIALSRDKRHLDRARLQVFWDILDRHIAMNRPQLRF